MPAAAQGRGARSAKAFVRYYVSAVNYAMSSGDVHLLNDLSTGECGSCAAVAENIAGVYSAGGHLSGKGWHATAIKSVSRQSARHPILLAGILINPQTKVAKPGARPKHFTGGKSVMTFYLRRQDHGWAVFRWEQGT